MIGTSTNKQNLQPAQSQDKPGQTFNMDLQKGEARPAPASTIPLSQILHQMKEIESSVTFRLPSLGKLGYSNALRLKPLLTKHQKILSNTPQFSRLPVFIEILKDRLQTIQGHPVDILGLSKDDFSFILFLYQISLDPIMTFNIQCGQCDELNVVNVNIEKELEKHGLEIEGMAVSETCMAGRLNVAFEPLRVYQLLDLYESVIKSNQKLNISEMRLYEMAHSITSITENETGNLVSFDSVEQKLEFLNELVSDDALKLETAFEKLKHGIDTTYKFKCDKCQFEETINLPLSTELEFFNLDEIEKLETILESQFILAKAAGIDLLSSDVLDVRTRGIMMKIVDEFYEKVEKMRKSNRG